MFVQAMTAADSSDLNIRQEKFVDFLLSGLPAGRAYEQAGYRAHGDVADTLAARMIRNDRVSKAIQAKRRILEHYADMSKQELVAYLCDVIRTPIGQLNGDSPLVQEYSELNRGSDKLITIKMVSKFQALKLLTSIMGWDKQPAASPTELLDRRLSEIICLIRSQGRLQSSID